VNKKIIIGIVVFGAFSVWQFFTFMNSAQRDDSGQVTEAGQVNAFEIKLGDCLNNVVSNPDTSTEFTEITAVPCSEPHEREVYAETITTGLTFDEEALAEEANNFCADSFQEFLGISYQDSSLYFDYFFPTLESWNQADDRKIQCLIGYEGYEKTTGTLENSMK
jgi:hypothetical protein